MSDTQASLIAEYEEWHAGTDYPEQPATDVLDHVLVLAKNAPDFETLKRLTRDIDYLVKYIDRWCFIS